MIKSEVKKDKKKLRKRLFIAFLVLIALFAITVFVFNIVKGNYRKIYEVGEELVFEQQFYATFNEIDIETKMTDLYIKNSVDGTVKLLVYGEKEYITFKERGDKLFIDINPKNLIALDFYEYITKVELYLPTENEKLIRISNEFGNIEVDEFINSTFDIEQEYGNVVSKGSSFIKIYSENGDIDIEKTTKGRVYSENSNIKIGIIDDLVIENENGDINIDSVNKYLKIENESGDININNIILETDSFVDNNYGDINIGMTNEVYIKANTDRGKKNIKNNYKKSDITLKIHNEDGNIKVEN